MKKMQVISMIFHYNMLIMSITNSQTSEQTNIIIYRILDDNVIERELDGNSVVKDYLTTGFVFVY